MHREHQLGKRYEEYAYVLGVNPRGRSSIVRGREGIIITAVGESHLTLLEVLGNANASFNVMERIYIGKQGRTKISSVLGKIKYGHMTESARDELPKAVQTIVEKNEEKFVNYLNNAGPLTSRLHSLELIPGIGKTYMKAMLDERDRQKFTSYTDLEERVGFKEPIKHISQRILEEIAGEARMNIFVLR